MTVTKAAFRVFIACLFLCAILVLIGIWFGENTLPEIYFKTAATFFIIGLASFLVWFSTTLLAIKRSSENQ